MSDLESYVTSIYGTKPKRGKRKESIDIKYDKEKVVTDEETSFKRPKIEADTADSKTGGPNLEKKNLESESLNGTWKSIDPNNSVTMSIKRGGLRDSSEIDAELNLKEKKRLEELARLAQENNVKKHEKIYRDKTGRKLTEAEVQLLEKKQQKHQHRDSYDESEPKLDQKTIADAKYKEKKLKQIKNENLNIYTNDPTLIASQKSEIKSEDPALLFDKKLINEHKNATQQKLLSSTGRKLYLHENEYPYNRFGVKPGWRWDGIVRGNGYEKKLLNDLINKKDSN